MNKLLKEFIEESINESFDPIQTSLDYLSTLAKQIQQISAWGKQNPDRFDPEELKMMEDKLEKLTRTLKGIVLPETT